MNFHTKYIRHTSKFMVFSETLIHREVAKETFGHDALIHGSGFLALFSYDEKVVAECYGKSESLNVSPRWDDDEKILTQIGVKNDEEDVYAHYLCFGGEAIVFSKDIPHEKVAKAAWSGFGKGQKHSSGGIVRIMQDGEERFDIVCTDGSSKLNTKMDVRDRIRLAEMFGISSLKKYK